MCGSIVLDGVALDTEAGQTPTLAIQLESEATLGGEIVTVTGLSGAGGRIEVRGPGSAPQAGSPIPGQVSISTLLEAGQSDEIKCDVFVTSLVPDVEESEAPQPAATVRVGAGMSGVRVHAPGCNVVRAEPTPTTRTRPIAEAAPSLPRL